MVSARHPHSDDIRAVRLALHLVSSATVPEIMSRTQLPRRRVTKALSFLESAGTAEWVAKWHGRLAYVRNWRIKRPIRVTHVEP